MHAPLPLMLSFGCGFLEVRCSRNQCYLCCSQVPEGKLLSDPPLLRLEGEACHAYLSMLLHLNSAGSEPLRQAAGVEQRLLALCIANLECFEVGAASQRNLLFVQLPDSFETISGCC